MKVFIIIATLLVAFFLMRKEGYQIIHYFQLNTEGKALLINTLVKEEKRGYVVMGALEGRSKEIFLKGPFPNNYVAKAEAQKYRLPQEISLWYNSKNPEIMALTKAFPKKTLIYLAILLSVGLYAKKTFV